MPSWKKLITSGSDASLTSLTVTNGVTGSLYGTASWAVSSSNAQNAQDILIYVKNVTGTQINKGSVVRISGATGDNALIATASYESDGLSANTLGLANQNIAHDSFGYVITEGTFIGLDTSTPGWVAGQLLYLGANGAITGSAPKAPLHAVRIGQVLRVQAVNGSMYVRIDNGYELGELHDVVDNTTTSSFGDLLIKSGSVWTNSRQLTGSYGLTGSFNINGSVLITGSTTIGAIAAGASENTLTLGPSPAGGAGEGGQLGLNAIGGTYTSASMIDTWQNNFRILKGSNAGSTALVAQWNLHTTQMQLPAYTGASSFVGTATANLAVDSSGNVITVSTSGGTVFPYTGNAVITGSLTATTGFIAPNTNGAMYLRGGDDAEFWDENTINTVGIRGQQNPDRAAIRFGTSGPTLFGSASKFGIGTITPTLGTLEVNGNVYATSFTGSLFGTASWAESASNASTTFLATNVVGSANRILFNNATNTTTTNANLGWNGTTLAVNGNISFGYASTLQSSNGAGNNISLHDGTFGIMKLRTNSVDKIIINYGSTGDILLNSTSTGNVGVGTASPTLGNLQVAGNVYATSFTGSLAGTASWAASASNAQTSSYSANIVGANNYIAKFTGVNTLSSSLIYDNGTGVMMGTTTPAARLTVTSAGTGSGVNGTAIYVYTNGGPAIDAGAANSSSISATNNSVNSPTIVAQNIGSGPIFSLKNNADVNVVHVLNNGRVGLKNIAPNADFDVSGSAIITGSLRVLTGITGSLQGTASWATSVVNTASNATAAATVNITTDNATNATYYPVFTSGISGNQVARVDNATLTYNPGTNTLTTTTFAGTATNATNVAVTNTTTGVGPYYVMFADATTGNVAARVDSAALTFNATTNTLTATSSYAIQALSASLATSADTLTTARTLTIGSTGKTFNGSANVAWSLAEIGAQAALTNPVTGTGTTNYLSKFTGTSTLGNSQIFDNGTSVGIGTTAPSFPLSFGTGLGNKVALYDAGSGNGYGFGIQSSLLQIFSNASSDDITFGYGNSAALTRNVTFKGTGNVGIGTTSPDSRLSVGLRAATDGNIRLSAAGTGIDSGASLLWDMNVGGGAAISHLAEIRPEAYATGTNKNILNFYVGLWNNSANSGTAKMTIAEDGKVGIGTTNPGYALDVNGVINAVTDVRAPIFYDSNNTGYSVNPASTSLLQTLDVSSACSAPIFYTYGSTSYYVNPGSNSRLFSLDMVGAISSTGTVTATSFVESSNSAYYFDGGNTGDSIRTAGNIVAYYSDERLKDKKGNIENALEKLLTLNGFYYEPNERAQELGYKKKLEIGVSAQEVEAVLPEIVHDAPIGYGYKTLDYSKLVPLLIEAIKEQQKQIDELKSIK